MQIKTTMRYYLTAVSIAIINKSTNNKCWRGGGEKGTHVHSWWECRLGQPLCKAVWTYCKKLKMELPHDPAISLLVKYAKKPKTLIRTNICTPMFTALLFTVAMTWKQHKCPSVDKTAVAHLHDGIVLGCKKEGNLTFCTDGTESVMQSEISQPEKDKYPMISLVNSE